MVWNWRLFGLTENLFKAVETHFATNTLGTVGGGKSFQNVNVQESQTAVTMTAENFAGRIQFLGRNLDVTTVNVGNGQAMDAIREVGPGAHFLGCAHTQANFETAFYRSKITDNNSFEQLLAEGELDLSEGTARLLVGENGLKAHDVLRQRLDVGLRGVDHRQPL